MYDTAKRQSPVKTEVQLRPILGLRSRLCAIYFINVSLCSFYLFTVDLFAYSLFIVYYSNALTVSVNYYWDFRISDLLKNHDGTDN